MTETLRNSASSLVEQQTKTFESGPVVRRKAVILGDGAIGKTSLIARYTTNTFPKDYIPTVFENRQTQLSVGNQRVDMALWDTAGQDDYSRLRPLSYTDVNVFVLCFSIDCRESFDNIEKKWIPEIKHYCPNVPILLVGLKADLRDDDNPELVPEIQVSRLTTGRAISRS
ncbi:ras-related C3 botulinum toxin substrate 2 [Gorgonomyces haynaldii]|nr:ras-related C3 botulinum toxin substrate 2 [Gorgonomyces haynaldii]